MNQRTPLYENHLQAGAKMVDFSGWDMPINYGSQVVEHEIVRTSVGMFDVSHMTVVDLSGPDSKTYLQKLLANNVDKLKTLGKALYTGMLNADGGVIDDLIVYLTENGYRLVVNCATREKDLKWMESVSNGYEVNLTERPDLAMVAVQGPEAINTIKKMYPELADQFTNLKPFNALMNNDWYFARTGYTGEDGFEIILPADEASDFWEKLLAAGVKPCGLAARDTLRLEAGMNLYGSDMDESVSPLQANMGWTVAFDPSDRDFIGREALETEKADGIKMKLAGLILEGRGVMRAGQQVIFPDSSVKGQITSGTFSPSLKVSIALARIPVDTGSFCEVEMRGKLLPARVVKLPFVRNGKPVYE